MLKRGFIKKSVGALTLGEKLKKIRKDKRLSLGEVSRATQIQVKYLEFLENGDFDQLPADVYVKGFLRSFADFFQIDRKGLLRLYEKEKEIKKNLERDKKPAVTQRKTLNISSFVLTPAKITFVVVSLLVFLGIFTLYKEVGTFAGAPRLVILAPQDNSETEKNIIFISGATDKDAQVYLNGQPILVSAEGKFKENITLQSGVNYINIKSVSKFKKEAQKTVSVLYKPAEEKKENTQENHLKENAEKTESKDLKLEIRVDPGPVWLSVKADDKPAFQGTMLSGSVQTFTAKDNFSVSSGKGNATFIKLNGEDKGALSQNEGTVKEKVFSRNILQNEVTQNDNQ